MIKDHSDSDERCRACRRGYPRPCACGGLIHAEEIECADGKELDRLCDGCDTEGEEEE